MPRKSPTQSGTWSVQEARDKFSTVVEAARRGRAQTVTRHGKPVVVMLAAEEFARLSGESRRKPPRYKDFKAALLAMPKDDGEFERTQIRPRDVEF